MQTKLKPIFLLIGSAAIALLLYTANDVKAQTPGIGFFDVSAFSPNVISISPKLGHPEAESPKDTMVLKQPEHIQAGQ